MHAAHQHRGWIFRLRHPRRIRPRRRLIELRRSLHPQRFMRTLFVVLPAETVKHALLRPPVAAAGEAVSCFSVRCMRS